MLVTVQRTQTATYSIIAGLLLVSAGSFGGGAGHAASGASLMSATSACAHRPATTASASTVKKTQATTDARDAAVITNTAQSTAAATPTPAATASATASATPTATATPSATDPPSPNATPTPSTTPTPDPSPTPTPSKTPTPKPSPTPTPSPKPTTPQLCVLVQPFSSSKVHPGGNATFAVWVWSTGAESTGATVTVTIGKVSDVETPSFTVCAQVKGDVCTVGDLLTSQSNELVAAAHVRDTAAAGEKVTLTATAQATKATSFHADSTIDVVAASTSTGSGSGSTSSGGIGDSLPGTSLPTLPDGSFTTTGGSDPSSLFPTVSPTSSATASSVPGQKGARHVDATTASSTLPLDSRLIGGQLAGLAVLASAIAVAIARLSLRSPRPHDSGGTQK
jgi:hypothetical protein